MQHESAFWSPWWKYHTLRPGFIDARRDDNCIPCITTLGTEPRATRPTGEEAFFGHLFVATTAPQQPFYVYRRA